MQSGSHDVGAETSVICCGSLYLKSRNPPTKIRNIRARSLLYTALSLFFSVLSFASAPSIYNAMAGAENTETPAVPRRVLLVSVPRTASNLFLKMLNIPAQPRIHTSDKSGYFFYSAFVNAAKDGIFGKELDQWTPEEIQNFQTTFQRGIDGIEEYTEQAKAENKFMWAKEHAFWFHNPTSLHKQKGVDDSELVKTLRSGIHFPECYGPTQTYSASNETVLSDEYLRTWNIAFIIRHPALAWPSMWRALNKIASEWDIDEDGTFGSSQSNMSMRWSRGLYDWCMEQPDVPTPPPVVDAHDLIHNPEVALKFCEQTGLDKSVVQFEWKGNDKKSESWAVQGSGPEADEQNTHQRIASFMLSTLETSSGIVKDKAPMEIDIGAEAAKWKVEFGEEAAQFIEQAVMDSMPDYEFLRARRITV